MKDGKNGFIGPAKPELAYPGAKEPTAPRPTADYHPTEIIGICTNCKVTGTIEFPPGTFSFNQGDRIMSNLTLGKILCLNCKKYTEFKPFDPRKDSAPGMRLLAKSQESLLRRVHD